MNRNPIIEEMKHHVGKNDILLVIEDDESMPHLVVVGKGTDISEMSETVIAHFRLSKMSMFMFEETMRFVKLPSCELVSIY